jgi:hypothetical protein
MSERKGPSKSATLYEVGTKKKGNDGNTWIIEENKNGVRRWVLYKKVTKNITKNVTKKVIKNNAFSDFTKFDYSVFDVIHQYKSFYELLIHTSLEYKINIDTINYDIYQSKVQISYHKLSQPKKIMRTNGLIIGSVEKNTFIWINSLVRKDFLNNHKEWTESIKNKKVIESIKKLFMYDRITFPEKYRQIIPFVLSYFTNTSLKNVIRFANDNTTKDFFYVMIDFPLHIPNGFNSTQYIYNELKEMKGGNYEDNNETFNFTRLIKDDCSYHIHKIDFNTYFS